ncbi:MAG TPA: PVC-type heme-binding CxxCH protein, partial [Prosthecobacter sp.]
SGVYVLIQQRQEVTAEFAAQMQPRKMYGPGSMKPAPSGLVAQADYPKGQSAQEALKNLQLPGGFKAELIAAEPDVVQPIAMCWDERGRLWVIEGNSYPKPREPGAGQDRILIFEDKDGDGIFETRKVFAEGISLASGIEIGFGGVWVGAAPYLMFIPDADRNDVPDESYAPLKDYPNVPGLKFTAYALLDGWGSQDTHETLNSFIWGPDGWMYGCHGVFTHSKVGRVGAPEGQRIPLNAAVWRYHPVRHVFEVFAHGTSNPWGLDYDQNGEFFVTACVIPHLYHIVPGARYFRQAGQHFNPYTYDDIKTIANHSHFAGSIWSNAHWGARKEGGAVADDTNQAGGGHAHCGLAIYQSNQFPVEYRNQLFFGNLHGHRLVTNYLDPKGSTYIGRHGSDFMRANDMNFIPVTQKVGPDGSLYVSDWSDKQVCHRGSNAIEMWDRSNGRIYRISYGERGAGTPARTEKNGGEAAKGNEADKSVRAPLFPRAPFDLSKESDESLAKQAAQTENEWFSRMARRVLTERASAKQISKAEELIRDLEKPRSVADELRALWLTAALFPDQPFQKIDAADAGEHVRAWQVRLASQNQSQITPVAKTANPYEGATLELMLDPGFLESASKDRSPVVRRELASALQRLPESQRSGTAAALLQHAEDKDDPYIPLLIWYGIEPVVGADAKAGLELAKASKMPKVTEFIYRRLGAESAGRTALLGIAAESTDAAQREMLLRTVVESARAGSKVALPDNWAALQAKLGSSPLISELEAFMGIETRIAQYREVLASQTSLAQREAALRILLQVRDAQTAEILHTLIQKEDPALTRRAVQALATLPHPGTPVLLIQQFDRFNPATKNDAISTLATNPAGAKALLTAVKDKKIPNSLLSPFLARQMDTLKDDAVKALIKEVWGDLNAPKADLEQRKVKFRTTLSAAALAQADAAKGKMIFSATCGTCHRLFGEGQNVGPDLTGSNRGNLDYLLDNVLDPNAVIGKDYQLNIFELNDGRIASGVIKEETAASYRVALPGGIEQVVTKAEIKKRTLSPMSTMPEGLFDALPAASLLDLVKYLQSGTSGGAQEKWIVPGAIEGESLKDKTKATGGSVRTQPMGGFKAGQWSGNDHLWWTGGKVGDKLTATFSTAKSGKQKVYAVFTKAPDYAIVTLRVDGKASGLGDLDLYDPAVVNTQEELLGEFDLAKGEHTLEITIQGRNASSRSGMMFALDYLRVE